MNTIHVMIKKDKFVIIITIITQCTDKQRAKAFALIRLGKISGRSKPGTGPAPRANVSTNLYQKMTILFLHLEH